MAKKMIPEEIKMKAIGEVLAGVDRLTYVADKYDISPSHLSREVTKVRRRHGWNNDSDKSGTETSQQLQHESFQEILNEIKILSSKKQELYKKLESFYPF